MRPPVFFTPPASHVISRKFEATPAATSRHDWRNLTTDTSIQIMSLESSAYHEENSMYDVTSQLSFVDTIISPRADDTFLETPLASSPMIDRAETLVSMDALTHHYGNMLDARIIFTPKQRCQAAALSNIEPTKFPERKDSRTDHYQQRLSRNFISDSNLGIQRIADYAHKNRHALVSRSLSLNYAECHKSKTDNCLLKPLRPRCYESKIGGVKRIPSFRNAMSTAAVIKCQNKFDSSNHLSKPKDLSINQFEDKELKSSISDDFPKSKITKLVKCGLRAVKKYNSNSSEKCLDMSVCSKNTMASEKKRQRKTRYSTNIGGLSEFLRKNERRKTISVITAVTHESNEVTSSKTNSELSNINLSKQSDNERRVAGTATCSRRLHSMGMSNLKFDQCQRKLLFPNTQYSPKLTADIDSVRYTDQYISPVKKGNSQTRHAPRLGVLGKTKPNVTLPIDELDIDVVCDLKRRLERANRCSRIKTNGSLKVRPKLIPVNKPADPSPRRKCVLHRQSRVQTMPSSGRHYRLKRESIV